MLEKNLLLIAIYLGFNAVLLNKKHFSILIEFKK